MKEKLLSSIEKIKNELAAKKEYISNLLKLIQSDQTIQTYFRSDSLKRKREEKPQTKQKKQRNETLLSHETSIANEDTSSISKNLAPQPK